MIITLVAENRIYNIRLPKKVEGQFWIRDDQSDRDNGLLLIDADADMGEWKITSNRKLQILDPHTGKELKNIILKPHDIYLLRMGKNRNQRAFLFTEPFTEDRCQFTKYEVADHISIRIGSSEDNDIVIKNEFVSAGHAILTYKNGVWDIKDCHSANGIYINRIRLEEECLLQSGDVISIMGYKFIVGTGFLAINNPDHSVLLQTNGLSEYRKQERIAYIEPELEEEPYYYRSPNFRREIAPLELKIDAPTAKTPEDDTPIILTIAPTLMMGVASLAAGIITTINALGKGNSIISVIPTLAMSVSMLAGMVVFPFFMKRRERKRKKIRELERVEKYQKYLKNIRTVIEKAARIQSEILNENCPNILQNIQEPDFWTRNLWNRKLADDDFLSFRFGIGNVPLQANIKFPEERFSIEEDILREQLIAFSDEKQIITDVPLVINLKDKRAVGIYGERESRYNLIHNLLLQIDTLYSYDEVKLIFLGSAEDAETFSYVRWMQHIWDDEKTFRYYATNIDDAKSINANVTRLLMETAEQKDYTTHYIVISTSKVLSEKCSFVSDILNNKTYANFHYICAFNELSQLPKECDILVQLVQDKGMIHFVSDENQRKTNITQDIISRDSVAQVVCQVADIALDLQKGKYALPGMLTFMDMFQAGKIGYLNIRRRWEENNPVLSLQTPIGIDVNGGTFMLDLHEKYHGPHGLVAGMTGSGKSEFIITYILSLAVNYHPNEVAFVLIDYKGGGLTGAFENDNYCLPHLAGTITNLDGAAITRSILSIKSELRRRQSIFNEARRIANEGTMDIYKYQKMYRNGKVAEPLPHLFIIADEFAELKTQQPEFMEQLISTARIGRSLGVHLILATQKPSGVVNEQIWANSRFKVCLKVQDKADSMDMLKRPDAAELAETGRFYLQVGYNEIFEKGQSAWCGAPYIEKEVVEEELDSSIELFDHVGNIIEEIKVRNEGERNANGKQIVRIMEYISELAANENITVRKLWLPEIPSVILVDEVREKYQYHKKDDLIAVIGELDDPYRQKQELLSANFTAEGNAVIYGASGSGKEMMITSMVYSLISDYSSDEVNIYLLDFGAELLKAFEKAPQVGEVITDGQDEKIEGLMNHIRKEIEKRKRLFAEYGAEYSVYRKNVECPIPMLLVVINNYAQFMESYEKYESELISFTRECVKYGIYFLFAESTVNGIRHRMMQNINQVFVLQFNDKSEYVSILGTTGGVYPAKINGRGIIKRDETYVFQTARVVKEQDKLALYLREKCNELCQENNKKAVRVPVLPDIINSDYFSNQTIMMDAVPIGISHDTLDVYNLNLLKKNFLAISSQRYEDAKMFANGLIKLVSAIPQVKVCVFTAEKDICEVQLTNVKYIYGDFENEIRKLFTNAVERNNNFKITNGNPTIDMSPIIYFFLGFDAIRKQISDDAYSKLYNSIEKTEGIYGLAYFAIENSSGFESYMRQSWFSRKSGNSGLWIGAGVVNQPLFMIMDGKGKLQTKKVDYSTGFYFDNGKTVPIRLITEKDGERDE